MSETEYLDHVDEQVQRVFDLATAARDEAQAAIVAAQSIRADLLRRKIELQRAELTARGDAMNNATIGKIQSDVDWLSGLPSRFPTHKSVERFQKLLAAIATARDYDPGETDLDDEQPVTVRGLDLGDVRLARRLLHGTTPTT